MGLLCIISGAVLALLAVGVVLAARLDAGTLAILRRTSGPYDVSVLALSHPWVAACIFVLVSVTAVAAGWSVLVQWTVARRLLQLWVWVMIVFTLTYSVLDTVNLSKLDPRYRAPSDMAIGIAVAALQLTLLVALLLYLRSRRGRAAFGEVP